jgi:hypothetical protein
MPAVLDQNKAKTIKPEAFVEKQIEQARGRIRTLDFFQTGLVVLIIAFAFVFALLLIDRSYETPRGTIWGALAVFVSACAGYVWFALYRPSRRHINPFFAARQVEQTIPDAKNSVVNYVDLEDDASVPASVKASIGARAARDMKHVDLNRAIQKKTILWLAGIAGVFLIAAIVAAFLPATRTTMKLLSPSEGNLTVVPGENVTFKVELNGRIPEKDQPDAARVRIWYNPEDPGNFEERLLEPVEGERNNYGYVLPAKQVRNGFWYQIFAGNVKTEPFEVKLRIIPQFTGIWEIEYTCPDYLKRAPDKRSDPKLVGYFGTQVTLTAHANRPVKSAKMHMQLDGQSPSIDNIPVANDPEAIRFQFPLTKNGRYQISFITTEGHSNPDPQWYTISLVDPQPVIRFFDVTYDFPKYLRFDPTTVVLREPNLEVNLGTAVTLVANANRPIRKAQLELNGVAIAGQPVDGEPLQAKFKLPPILKDSTYRVWFTPDTNVGEPDSKPRTFTIRVITDKNPEVDITNPQQIVSEIPANGSLPVEGIATDDHGVAKVILHLEVIVPAPNMPLAPMPYRGKEFTFVRKGDNSYPAQVAYKDIIELAKLKTEGENGAAFSVQPGMEIEYWLEAIDNCDVPVNELKPGEQFPGNSGFSRHLRIKVLAPEMNPEKKKKQEKERQAFEQDKEQHEKKQDQKNANEKRDPNQPAQRDDQKQLGGEPGQPEPKGDRKEGGMGPMMPDMDQPMDPAAEAELKKREDELKNALDKVDPKGGMGGKQADMPGDPPMKEVKLDPNNPKKEEPKDPKNNDEPKMPEAKPDEKPDPRQMPKPEDVKKLADKLNSKDQKEQEEAREQIKQRLEQAKNDKRKAEEAQKEFDEHRKKLNDGERKQFDESCERVGQEINDIEREKRVNDAVEKLTSGDKQKQQEGQQQLEKELRDPKGGKKSEQQLQHLAGDMGTERQKQIGDAMNLARENMTKNPPKSSTAEKGPMPKEKEPEEEKDVDKLAKKNQKGNEEEKKQAQEQLEKMLRNPATRDKVQQQLEDYKSKIKDKQERDEFEKMMKDIAENAKKDMDPDQRRAEDIKKLAEQLKSEDKKERDAAQKQLEESLKQADKNPKAQADAQKQLKDARDSIKDPKQQERFDQAVKEINEAVQKHREEKAAAEKKTRDELENIAKGFNDKDPAKREEAERKLAEKLQDPRTREQVKDELDKLKKNTSDAAAKENIDKATEKALDDLNRKEGLDKIGKDINSKDPERQQAAREKIEDMLADPKTRDQVKNELDKLKEAMKDQDSKDRLEKAVKDAEKNIANNKQQAEQIAKDLNSKDPEKQKAAQQKLEEALKDPARGEQVKNELERLKREAGDAETKQNIDKATQKALENIARQKELERLANDLNSKDGERQKNAQQKLEDKLADPKNGEQVKKDLDKIKDGLKSQQAKDKVDDAVEQAEKHIAQNKQEAGKLAQDLTGKDKGKQDAAQNKLEELLKDPAKREQIKNELERLKGEMGDDQAKAKIDEAIRNAENNLAKKDGKPGEPKKEDLEQIARDLNSKDANKEKAAEGKLLEALKDPKTRQQVEKQFNDIKDKLADAGEKQKLTDALNKAKDDIAKLEKPLDPKEIEKLIQDLKSGDKKAAEAAQKKLDEMLDDPILREKLAKAIEELMKNIKDGTAKKELDDPLKDLKERVTKAGKAPDATGTVKTFDGKTTGDNTKEPAKETAADLKKKIKSGDLLLEQFRKNITNEEFRKQLGWTDEQIREFMKKYEQQLAQLKKQLAYEETGEILPRATGSGPSKIETVGTVKRDPTGGDDPIRSGRGIAPPGFGDAYEKFTTDVSGVEKKATPPPPGK